MAEDIYIMAVEREDHSAKAIIICCEGPRPDVIAGSTSHSQALTTLVRRANRGARAEMDDELRRLVDSREADTHPSTDGWPASMPRSADWAARDAEDGGS